jgi:hypothetical protein
MQTVRMGGIRRPAAKAAIGAVTAGLVGGALTTGAAAAATIRLKTSIAPVLQSSAEGIRFAAYTVTVRSAGGTARDTRLAVTTQLPAQWSIFPANCQAVQGQGTEGGLSRGQATPDRAARLVCALGEVTGRAKVAMTLQLPAGARVPGGLGIQAVASAANAAGRSTASAAVPLRPLATFASAPEGATPSVAAGGPAAGPGATPGRTTQAAAARQRTPAASEVRPQARSREAPFSRSASAQALLPAQRPLVPPLVPLKPSELSAPAAPTGPWLPTMNPKAPVRLPKTPHAPSVSSPVTPALAVPQLPAVPQDDGTQTPDDTSPMSLTTVPQVPDGQCSWARALAVVVVAEAAVLWLAASLGLWRRRLLVGQAVGNGVRNARLLRPAAALLRRAPLLRARVTGRAAIVCRRLRLRR